ncbi:hypothetical protein M430DRAFT_61349 [Amorphotheca resinae ATCC 22711]|jgi:hypothetical protein|uniref:Uncharacterized protein n=1 Tax=Amorphotheca resinae ATCC 22711 TaxID=857342 RepID=A0A2T3ARG4_AMORE|nr:hypothetical protein M430DRAFT_61349 [Amorphotheca resinae ATCC 22711]PSS08944.1 hypothetical protein M430DRAFT_61349 [Amorphotheca resinae ATCC 22711]
MNSRNDLGERIDSQPDLRRIPSTCDLPSLVLPPRRASGKSRESQSFARRSKKSDSENSDVLYMIQGKRPKRRDRSLSLISNNSARRLDGPSDKDADCEEYNAEDNEAEKLSGGIIDQEIFEWQYVCRTGRPYWWSPESKYKRLNRLGQNLANKTNPRTWREVDDGPKEEYTARRRAVSDSFLADPNTVEDMAHMVAVRLLSSCFTLPPDPNTRVPSPTYIMSTKDRTPSLPDSRMISSLRMHTGYRYSPCFGHQARNTSPVQPRSGTYYGPSPHPSPPPTAPGGQTPVIGTSEPSSRPRRIHRALHVTEGSATSCSLDSHTGEYLAPYGDNVDLNPTVTATAWYRRQVADDGQKISEGGHEEDSTRPPKTNDRMHSAIRSEPHHVLMQPVKKLVVKRWRTFRRRIGGSLHSQMPATASEERFITSSSGVSSPRMSSDAKERRRRARASGHMDSNSCDSTPHYNSPVSGHLSPNESGMSSPFSIDSRNPSPKFTPTDPPAGAASLALTGDHVNAAQGQRSISLDPPASLESSHGSRTQNSPNLISVGSMNSQERSDIGPAQHPNLNSTSSSPSPSVVRSQARRGRRSLLSEMYTAEDLVDDTKAKDGDHNLDTSILGSASSTLCPTEQTKSTANMSPLHPNADARGSTSSGSTPRKQRLSRTSMSGTQIFRTGDEGVEIDGLPVGPSKHLWDGRGKRRERTYL